MWMIEGFFHHFLVNGGVRPVFTNTEVGKLLHHYSNDTFLRNTDRVKFYH